MSLLPRINLSKKINASSSVLVIFCKWPRLSHGKQRLAESIGVSKAFQLASLFIDCVLEDAAEWDGEVVFAISDDADFEQAQSVLQNGITKNKKVSLLIQPSGNLGQRINKIDSELRKQGKEKLVFIGTDSPILNDIYFQQAKTALNLSDVVLSNAHDGGVIIMANSKAWPNLRDLPWSTEYLSEALSQCCVSTGLSVRQIISGYDIDIESDLDILFDDVKLDTRPSRQALFQWLSNHFGVAREVDLKLNQQSTQELNQESNYVR